MAPDAVNSGRAIGTMTGRAVTFITFKSLSVVMACLLMVWLYRVTGCQCILHAMKLHPRSELL